MGSASSSARSLCLNSLDHFRSVAAQWMTNGRNSKTSLASLRETINEERRSKQLRMVKKVVVILRQRRVAKRRRANEGEIYINIRLAVMMSSALRMTIACKN